MASIQNEIIGIIFISIIILCILNWKQIQLAWPKYQLSPWLIICTSFIRSHHIIQMAMDYTEIVLYASKLHVFNTVLIFCPHSTDVEKYNYGINYMLTMSAGVHQNSIYNEVFFLNNHKVFNIYYMIHSNIYMGKLHRQQIWETSLFFPAPIASRRAKNSLVASAEDNSNDFCHPWSVKIWMCVFNTLKPEQNGCHLPDNILKCIFFSEAFCFLIYSLFIYVQFII